MLIKFIIYISMQVLATLLFKWGSDSKEHWMLGFILGNVIVVASIWFLMEIYRQMNPNIAMAVAVGGAFLAGQLAMSLTFKIQVSSLQWFGIAMIICGVVIVTVTKKDSSVKDPAILSQIYPDSQGDVR